MDDTSKNTVMESIREGPKLICPRCKNDSFKIQMWRKNGNGDITCLNCKEDMFRYGFFAADVLKESKREEDIVTEHIARSRKNHGIEYPVKKIEDIDWLLLRQFILIRDNYQCQCKCNSSLGINCSSGLKGLDVHHIRQRKDGGSNHPDNLVTLCENCHMTGGNHT